MIALYGLGSGTTVIPAAETVKPPLWCVDGTLQNRVGDVVKPAEGTARPRHVRITINGGEFRYSGRRQDKNF